MDLFTNFYENEEEKSYRLLSWEMYKYMYVNEKSLNFEQFKVYKELEVFFVNNFLIKSQKCDYYKHLNIVNEFAMCELESSAQTNVTANELESYVKKFPTQRDLLFPFKRIMKRRNEL
ncbi:MAG: hypothetical protein IJZ93_05685 [Clostridia bacterium]|nr:hypothetical protein [Clostridia bacterium]